MTVIFELWCILITINISIFSHKPMGGFKMFRRFNAIAICLLREAYNAPIMMMPSFPMNEFKYMPRDRSRVIKRNSVGVYWWFHNKIKLNKRSALLLFTKINRISNGLFFICSNYWNLPIFTFTNMDLFACCLAIYNFCRVLW